MTADIRRLEVVPSVHDTDAIALIEDTLARIKSGEVVAVAVVEVVRGGKVCTAWAGGGNNYHLLNSGAARLASRMAAD